MGSGGLTGGGMLLALVLSGIAFLMVIGRHVGGVRYAVEGKELFDATGNARLLLRNRGLTGRLVLNFTLLILITSAATAIGFLLLILPGLFMFVTCSLATWHLLAGYGMEVASEMLSTPNG